MVELNSVQCLYFSPTGNTKKIIHSIAKGIGLPIDESIDLTLPKNRDRWSGHYEGDMLLVGLPVYGSTYPSIILPSLKKLKGEGKFAIPIAVCGNCKMGSALAEMCVILKKQGFTIPAAGNFVGEHSCATDEFRLGTGRPDEQDLMKAYEYGQKIAAKLKDDPKDITSIYSGKLHIQIYANGSLDAKGYMNDVWESKIFVESRRENLDQCNNCLLCVESCPTGAIDSNSLEINDLACVRCFACTSVCPKGVLKKHVVPLPELTSWWKIQEKLHGEPLLFI
jgi:ferredoxin